MSAMTALTADFSPPAVDRKFWLILAGSVLLHATLFLVTAWERKQGPLKMPPLLASIRLAVPAVGEMPQSVPLPAAPALAASAQSAMTPPVTQAARRAVAATALAVPAAVQPAASVQAAASLVPSALPPMPSVAESTPVATAPVAPTAVSTDVAAEALARYRQRLTSLLARQQSYPRIAEMRGWEGEVRLRLRVARKGQLLAVALDRSSGHAVLDDHAASMLAELGTLPPLPEAVEGSEIQVVVPVNYRLNKTT
ncbi:TonB family protein [Dechloromonas sp.]|uniref:TonB family protein n=1 Tax=Dechloromonas sp. TaxID=1917218 RepID=UPI00122469D9|nr:TonB family protein [Dechloromonas sp.]MBU3697142.1 energy transducer TonB [Dechloromonas sp.]TEX44202.1 MAG: hypothetical protein CFR70_14795 [Rhodocyclaceae bacterium]